MLLYFFKNQYFSGFYVLFEGTTETGKHLSCLRILKVRSWSSLKISTSDWLINSDVLNLGLYVFHFGKYVNFSFTLNKFIGLILFLNYERVRVGRCDFPDSFCAKT